MPMTLILGDAQITPFQALAFIESRATGLYPPDVLSQIVFAYWSVGDSEGVRPEVGLSQSLKETGYFRFGGDVKPDQFNFAGIGATGGIPGHSWPTITEGVRGHLRRLKVYATPAPIVSQFLLHDLKIMLRPLPEKYWGSAPHVEELSGKWAPSASYGASIVDLYLNPMLNFPDPSRPLEPAELVKVRKLLAP